MSWKPKYGEPKKLPPDYSHLPAFAVMVLARLLWWTR